MEENALSLSLSMPFGMGLDLGGMDLAAGFGPLGDLAAAQSVAPTSAHFSVLGDPATAALQSSAHPHAYMNFANTVSMAPPTPNEYHSPHPSPLQQTAAHSTAPTRPLMRTPLGAGVGVGLLDDAESDAGHLSASVNGLQLADPIVAAPPPFIFTDQKTHSNLVPVSWNQLQSWGAPQPPQGALQPAAVSLEQHAGNANAAQFSAANLAPAGTSASAGNKQPQPPVPMNDLLFQLLMRQQEQQQRLDQLQRALLVAQSSPSPRASAPNVPALAAGVPVPVAVSSFGPRAPPDSAASIPTLTALLNSSCMQPVAGPTTPLPVSAQFVQLPSAPPSSTAYQHPVFVAENLNLRRARNETLGQQQQHEQPSQAQAVRIFIHYMHSTQCFSITLQVLVD